MTRNKYISHLDEMYAAVMNLIKLDAEAHRLHGQYKPGGIEEDRAKKTEKMVLDLATRFYEDGAISRRIREENLLNGRGEQDEFDFDPEVK